MIAETIGGATVEELAQRMSVSEFFEWAEWFSMKREVEDKARREAEQRARLTRRR